MKLALMFNFSLFYFKFEKKICFKTPFSLSFKNDYARGHNQKIFLEQSKFKSFNLIIKEVRNIYLMQIRKYVFFKNLPNKTLHAILIFKIMLTLILSGFPKHLEPIHLTLSYQKNKKFLNLHHNASIHETSTS